MCHTSICIGGNFEWLVYEWVPIFRAQVYDGVGFEDVGPHLRTKTTAWLPPR